MEDRKQFEKLLKPILKQLFVQLILKEIQLLLLLTGAMSFLLLIIARLIVIPFLENYFLLLSFASVIYFFLRVWRNRPTLRDAASIFNKYVSDDRVITAYSFLNEEGIIASLQLSDAIKHMKLSCELVLKRKKKLLYPKWLFIFLALIAGAIILFISPNENIHLAKQKEKEIKLVQQTEEKLNEEIKKAKDPELKKALENAKDKLSKSKSAEEALTELAKQKKELELKALKEKDKQLAMKNWKSELKKAGLTELEEQLNQKNLKAVMDELTKLNEKWNELSEDQKQAFNQLAKAEGQLTDEELEKLKEQIENALNSEEFLAQLAAAQQALQQVGLAMQNQMAKNGMPPNQLSFAPPGQPNNQGNPSNGQPNGQNGQSQQPNSNGQSPSNGNGAGSGQGSGTSSNGNGSGSGSGGSGSGSGNGQGMGGSGAGKGQGSRELLTIPDRINGETNMETDSGSLGEGSSIEQTDGTGPILRGTIKPYSEVFESYEKAYRQSTERYKLPADLEEIVKNYFTNIDPNKE